ncbi:MAG: hypothetical protein DRP46_00375 [Candidatus Zixiibacteriota bacterium]|nr:MAG: hypothetical protein DRP46_00375 [candidate division Zixibacteria bacterium]
MISILHIVLSTVTGGMENFIYNLATVADLGKYRMSIGCLQEIGYLSEKMAKLGVETQLVNKMIPGFSIIYPRQLIKFIKNNNCRIVHTHSGCWPKVAAACARIPGVKLLYTEHGRGYPDNRLTVWQDKIASHYTDTVVAVSQSLREYLISKVGVPDSKVITINNGIDTERFKPSPERAAIREELGLTDSEFAVGVVARLAPVKNHRFLINAFRQVVKNNSRARLFIIGDGPLRAELEELTASYGLEKNISFLGDRNDVPRILAGLDAAALSSLSEGISLTILEAMSCGLPVVATAVGGNSEIIKNGQNGFLVDTDNTAELADKLSLLGNNPELRAQMGRDARDNIMSKWSLSKMNERYQGLYDQLLTKK